MLTDHETRPDHEDPRDGETPRASVDAPAAQQEFPTLEEPSWLEDDLDDEMEDPRDSPFRGIWVGVVAAAATFILVFAIPHWLGWYDLAKPGQQATRESTPESVISTTKPSTPADQPPTETPSATAPRAPKDAEPVVAAPKTPPRAAPPAPTPADAKSASHETPAKASAASKRTYSVQIAAFKNARQANRLANRVKRDGYRADVKRVESSPVPWVVRIDGYASREQAESARDALARKGFRGFIL